MTVLFREYANDILNVVIVFLALLLMHMYEGYLESEDTKYRKYL
jgi:hypothetical protein